MAFQNLETETVMIKRTLKWIWHNVWSHKFLILTILLGYLSIYLGGRCTSQKQEIDRQKQEVVVNKAKLDAVSALFKPTATACPRIEPLKCPLQARPVAASYRSPAPREAAPVPEAEDQNSRNTSERKRLLDLARKALDDDIPIEEDNPGQTVKTNPAINRRDQKGRLTTHLPAPNDNGSRVRVIKVQIPSWVN